jgi:uncharacterized protein YjbJ (UPF0337 family)
VSVGAFKYSLPNFEVNLWLYIRRENGALLWGARFDIPSSRVTEPVRMGKNWRKKMNWEQVEGKWKQYSGKLKEKWGKLTDDDLQQIGGRREQLVGKIQERYGIAKEQAESQINEFTRSLNANIGEPEPTRTRSAGKS